MSKKMFLFCQQKLRELRVVRTLLFSHQIIVMLLAPAEAPWAKAWDIYCGVRAGIYHVNR